MGMTFIELGSILRAEREKQGLSIDDVAHRLKISARVLRALECADDDALPHSVYVRGFVISYGKLLGLDTDEMLLVEELYDASEDPSNNESQYVHRGPSISASKILFVLFLCLCIAGGTFIWLNRDADLFSKIKKDHLTTAQPAPAVPANVEVEKTNTSGETSSKKKLEETTQATNSEQATEKNQQNINKTESVENSSANTNEAEANTSSAQAVVESSTQATSNNDESTSASNVSEVEQAVTTKNQPMDGPHRVIITAVAECWVHSKADDSDTRQFSLQAGDTFALTFTDNLSLKLGNAGGVRIRYNGAETPIPGREGEVKTLTFPPV